jgi:hypothetical protein
MTTLTIEHPQDRIGEIRHFHNITTDVTLALNGQQNGHEGILKISNLTANTYQVFLPIGDWLEENSPHPIEVKPDDRLEITWTVDNDSVDWNYSFYQQIP